MAEKRFSAKIINDERLIINMHSYNPFKNRAVWNGNKRSKHYNQFMSKKEYFKNMRKWCARLWQYQIDSSKCKFITLTLKENLDWDTLITKFQIFIKAVRRNFGASIEFIRGIEVQEYSHHFHIHLILIFEDTPPIMTKEWIEKHWKYGSIYIDEETNVYDIYGLMEYLTLFKIGSIQDKCSGSTYFPKGAKIIATSLTKTADIREIEISEDHYKMIRDYYDKEFYAYDGKQIREDGHLYVVDGKTHYCLDKVYIQCSKEYIINNFGTKEDDIIIANNEELKKFAEIKDTMKNNNVF